MTHVLVIDDNTDWTDTLAELLHLHGYEAASAYTGQQGLQVAEEFRPDVVILDISMPPPDGLQVCTKLREVPWGRSARVIGATGWTRDTDVARARMAGFDHLLTKPVLFESLQALLPSN